MTRLPLNEHADLTCDTYNDDPTRVRRVAALLPPRETFYEMASLLKVLADPARATILAALAHEHLCVCELSALLGMSTPAVSYHLKMLAVAGLVRARKEGKFACYHLRDERVAKILGALLEGFGYLSLPAHSRQAEPVAPAPKPTSRAVR
ncbi:MAG: ArsR/SmtB family transcription factor [Chthonomonadales bacterium]